LHDQLPRSAIFEKESSFTAEAQREEGKREIEEKGEKKRKDLSLSALFLFPLRRLGVLCASAVKGSRILKPYCVKRSTYF